MPDANDMDLVQEFARGNSEAAFNELVRRHLNLVYSIARRRTGNDGDAQDVTQAVFIILARKADSLGGKTILPGWLYETTRFTATRWLRTQARRAAREQEAYMQSTLNEADTANVWTQLAPHLEAAMDKLAARDRALLALRFYEHKSGPEAAALLGIGEDAARKRVTRAIEKLRKILMKRGVTLTAAAIAGAVSANSIQAAPATLAKTISAVAIAKGAAAGGSILMLVKGTMKTMAWLKTTLFAVILTNVIVSQKIVATHFDFAGNPDGWMTHSNYVLSSWMFGCGFPLFFVVTGHILRFLPIKAFNLPNRDYWLALERRDETFNYLFRHFLWQACFAAVFALALQLMVVQANRQTPPHFSSPPAWVAAGCFIAATAVLIGISLCHFRHNPTHTHPTPYEKHRL